jgi:hypothetical protein
MRRTFPCFIVRKLSNFLISYCSIDHGLNLVELLSQNYLWLDFLNFYLYIFLPKKYKYSTITSKKDLECEHPVSSPASQPDMDIYLPISYMNLNCIFSLFSFKLTDYTHPSFLTLLFTDIGILTPSAVSDELVKLYQ